MLEKESYTKQEFDTNSKDNYDAISVMQGVINYFLEGLM